MSSLPSKPKRKIINIKTLILQTNDKTNFKYKSLKLSSLKKLIQTKEENHTNPVTERNEKLEKSSSRKKMEDLCKTMRETNKKIMKKINIKSKNNSKNIYFNNNNFNKIPDEINFCTNEENDLSNINMVNTYREKMKIRNLLLEYSGVKPENEQKFLQANKKFIKNKKLINKFFLNSKSLVFNSSKNNNNNYSFKTNNSNTLNESEGNNFIQKSIHLKYQEFNPLITANSIDKYINNSKRKINSNNINRLLINNTFINNNIISKSKKIFNIYKNYSRENKTNSKNHSNVKNGKKRRIQLLIKQEPKPLKKTLPYREKLLNDIKKNIISKNKYNFIHLNNKKLSFENLSNKLNNTITISNNSRKKRIKNINEKKITKGFLKNNKNTNINNHSISEMPKKYKDLNKNSINPSYTKKTALSPTPPKTKENTITTTIKDSVYKKVVKIDSCTLAGYNSQGVQKINQDNLFIKKNFLDENDQFFIGVCDGHGDYGHSVSSYISKCLPNFLADTSDKNIICSYNSLNRNLVENSKIDCTFSGTTCTSIILNPEKIISLNLGDSRVVLAKYEKGDYTAVNLSTDHKPNISSEKKRILINGGRIKPYYDEKAKKFLGPDRVWLRDDELPGLAMTRSFGDTIAHSVGVISEPEIKRYDFTANEKFIIIASDGIWEYISSQECVDIVKEFYEKNLDAVGAINAIMKEGFNRWKKLDEIIDDITAIIIFFDPK